MVIFKCRYWNYCAIKCVYKQKYQGSIFIHAVARKAEKIMTLFESDLNQSWTHGGLLFCTLLQTELWSTEKISVEKYQSSVAGVQVHSSFFIVSATYGFQNWCLRSGWHLIQWYEQPRRKRLSQEYRWSDLLCSLFS